jgi:hypothetical protein
MLRQDDLKAQRRRFCAAQQIAGSFEQDIRALEHGCCRCVFQT